MYSLLSDRNEWVGRKPGVCRLGEGQELYLPVSVCAWAHTRELAPALLYAVPARLCTKGKSQAV